MPIGDALDSGFDELDDTLLSVVGVDGLLDTNIPPVVRPAVEPGQELSSAEA